MSVFGGSSRNLLLDGSIAGFEPRRTCQYCLCHRACIRSDASSKIERQERQLRQAYASFTFQKIGAPNLRTSRTFFSKYGGLYPFAPRHVGHFAEGYPLDLVSDLFPLHVVVRPHQLDGELFKLRDRGPAEPRVRSHRPRATRCRANSSRPFQAVPCATAQPGRWTNPSPSI
jgi:hypothetical protein